MAFTLGVNLSPCCYKKAKYEQLQQEKQALTQANQKLLTEGRYYFDQAQQYRKKFLKAAPYFPKYVAPTSAAE